MKGMLFFIVIAAMAATGVAQAQPTMTDARVDALGDLMRSLREQVDAGNTEFQKKLTALEARLAAVKAAVVGLPRPRVGCIELLDPPFSAGHWVPEMVTVAQNGGSKSSGNICPDTKKLSV